MIDLSYIFKRKKSIFCDDLVTKSELISERVTNSRFLIIGAAGSIGRAVTNELFRRNPKSLHAIDISENNLAELVRNLRSSHGYIDGEFKTFCIDCGTEHFDKLYSQEGGYDYILNLSALKHVRSEKDPFTLIRMIDTNIFNTIKSLKLSSVSGIKNYFCVSTDKAANPVNMMGASKRIMEMFLMRESLKQNLSMARFANVAFSDGSLLHGFNQRISLKQPLAAPCDVKRYFVTPQESGELCLLSTLFGENRDIFFPKLNESFQLITFSDIARKFLDNLGYEPFECDSEDEARDRCHELVPKKKWPCYFFKSDTTGEKDIEEFFTESETLELNKFSSIGIIKNEPNFDEGMLTYFESSVKKIKQSSAWRRSDLISLFHEMIPDFAHKETGKFLDQKM